MSEAVFMGDDVVEINPERLAEVKQRAQESPRKRFRLCLHRGVEDTVHEMVIAFSKQTYIRPHRHPGCKTESYHIIEGEMTVLFFDDEGRVTRRIEMGEPRSGRTCLYRLSSSLWHMPAPRTDMVVFHETFLGTFDRDRDVEEAPWGPAEGDAQAITDFLEKI